MHAPVDNSVSLGDALDSFQAGENWVEDIANATADVASSDPLTVIEGYNLFAKIEAGLHGNLLNGSSTSAMNAYTADLKTKVDAFLQSVPLMIQNPSTYTDAAYVQPTYGSDNHPATMYDLVMAIVNNDTTDQFHLNGVRVDGNEGLRDECGWNTSKPDLNYRIFDKERDNNFDGISAVYKDDNDTSCHQEWHADFSFSLSAMERIANVNVDAAGNPVDLTKLPTYQAIENDANSLT